MPVSATASAIVAVDSLRGVVLHVQPLPHHVGREVLEAGAGCLNRRSSSVDLLAAVHALDLEGRLGVQLADGAGGRHARFAPRAIFRSWTCSSPCSNRPTMCWSSRV